jgi:hypothetical protein
VESRCLTSSHRSAWPGRPAAAPPQG